MDRSRFLASVSILSLSLGFIATASPQDKHMEIPQGQDKHAGLANTQKAQPKPRAQRAADKGRPIGQQKQVERSPEQLREQQRTQQRAWQERRANHWEYEHRNWQQRGGYNGYRVPDDYFRDHYGDAHAFRVYGLPFMYEKGNPRFQYDGYWFTRLDPYPESWGGRWYETDDLYVNYKDDGYYLFNRSFPGTLGIALSVSL